MGNTSSAISSAGTIDSYIGELGDVAFDKLLNQSRFLKCVRGRHKDGRVIVKIFVKSEPINLKKAAKQREKESEVLLSIPNALSYQRALETDRAVYLLRQHIASNLYDRISTRPFFEPIEKRWIVFQLLKGLRDCHAKDIHHGDIKTENVLVTTWNWIYLTDFAFFKPTYLPENNPAAFSYYFDTSFRRTCYLAPERFYGQGEVKTGHVTDAMDIFSLGCVIAELFLEGSPLFDLSQMFKYKAGEYDPMLSLNNIENTDIRSLIAHMISLDPNKRYSAEAYLDKWQGKAFPKYFSTFLHEYAVSVSHEKRHHVQNPSTVIDDELDRIHSELGDISFLLGFHETSDTEVRLTTKYMLPNTYPGVPNYRSVEVDYINRAAGEDVALIFLGILLSGIRHTTRAITRVRACDTIVALSERISDEARLDRIVPFLMSLASDQAPEVRSEAVKSLAQVLARVQFLTPVNAFVFPELVLPALSSFTTDSSVLVRLSYAQSLSLLATTAARFLDLAAALREEGFLTIVGTAVHRGENIDIGALKDNIGDLELGQTDTAASSNDPLEEDMLTKLFDTAVQDQRRLIHEHTVAFLTDPDSNVKRALLQSISDLSIFFGRRQANDLILGHLITYLNDSDWLLRANFFDHIVSLSLNLGRESVEEYVINLTIQALTDAEDFIVERVLIALSGLYQQNMIGRQIAINLVGLISKFFIHPNLWIQEAATAFVVVVCENLTAADIHCFVYPHLSPFLRIQISSVSAMAILQSLRRPLQAEVLQQAMKWAARSVAQKDSTFWNSVDRLRDFSGDINLIQTSTSDSFRLITPVPNRGGKDKGLHYLRVPAMKSADDDARLSKLRELGMKVEDDWKLMILREYIWRSAQFKYNAARLLDEDLLRRTTIIPAATTVTFDQLGVQDRGTSSTKHNPAHDVQNLLRDTTLALDYDRTRKSLRKTTTSMQNHIGSPHSKMNPSIASNASPTAPSSLKLGSEVRSVPEILHSSAGIEEVQSQASSINGDAKSSMIRVGSSANLRGPGIKAAAAVSTTNMVVLGQVDHHCADNFSQPVPVPQDLALPSHTYGGTDKTVIQVLENVYRRRRQSTSGILVSNVAPIRPAAQLEMSSRPREWKGILVAHIHEHRAAINCVRVSQDHVFFLTASDDGSIRAWDASRLERNVANRSRTIYRGMVGSKVRHLCFLENSYCVAAASDQGSVQIIRIDCTTDLNNTAKFAGMQMIRDYQLDPGESAVQMEHFVQDDLSVLLIATNRSRIIALDVLTMTILYTLLNPARHGTPTSFCTDKDKNWLLLGTTRGILDLWDLRFKLRLKSIGMPEPVKVNSVRLHPNPGDGKWVCITTAANAEITVWDIETVICQEVYRPRGQSTIHPGNYRAWNVEDDKPEQVLARFTNEVSLSAVDDNGISPISTRTVTVGLGFASEDNSSDNSCLICASTDQKIRIWNIDKPESSTLLSGLDVGESMPGYQVTETGTPRIVTEMEPLTSEKLGAKSSKLQPSTPSRSAALAMQQSHLLSNHMDIILDVAYLQRPYNMVISVDRSGVLKVFA